MSIKYCKKTRRQFLVGTGKAMIALPLLPSLLPKEAYAQVSGAVPNRLMMFHFDHGNIPELWPNLSLANTPVGNIGAMQALIRSLGTNSQISSAFSNARYQSIINNDLMTILRGFGTAQGGGAHGNYLFASSEGRNSEGNYPTFDTVIEASQTVYPSSTTGINVTKALRAGWANNLFFQKVGSGIQVLPVYQRRGIENFYNEVFSSLTNGSGGPVTFSNQSKSNVLNKVFSSFQSFRNNRRISANDQARLTQHMDHISDLQRSFASVPNNTQSCSAPSPVPSGAADNSMLATQTYLDLYALAFKCGLTKYGSFSFEAHNPTWIPGLNLGTATGVHDAIHGGAGSVTQESVFRSYWGYYCGVIADRFLSHLDEEEGTSGKTYMENMLTTLGCAGGIHSLGNDGGHSSDDSQQILIGNMGGKINSGNFINYPSVNRTRIPLNTFILTMLHAMDVPPSEYAFATPDGRGFGYYRGRFSNPDHHYRSRYYQHLTEIMS